MSQPRFLALALTLVVALNVSYSQETKEPEPSEPLTVPQLTVPQLTAPQLTSALSSPLVGARVRALRALASQADISDELWPIVSTALDDEASAVRQKAFRLYAAHPAAAKATVDRLLEKMADDGSADGEPVWVASAAAIVAVGPSVIGKLVQRLDPEKNETEYRAACAALSEFGSAATPALDRLIAVISKDDDIIGPALFVIQKIGPKAAPAVPALIARLEDENFHHQYWACRALGAIGRQAEPSVPKLIDLLKNGVTSVRRNAAMALGEIGVASDPVLDDLTKALTDPIAPVRQEALLALGKFGPKSARALDRITEMATAERGSSQSDAALAWWQIDNQSDAAIEVLFRELKRRDAPWDAARHLAKVAERAGVIERITEMLDEPNEETRIYVIETIEQIGPPARFAKARLKSLLNDPVIDVREAAAKAILAVDAVPSK